jgi:hypothetical protein
MRRAAWRRKIRSAACVGRTVTGRKEAQDAEKRIQAAVF